MKSKLKSFVLNKYVTFDLVSTRLEQQLSCYLAPAEYFSSIFASDAAGTDQTPLVTQDSCTSKAMHVFSCDLEFLGNASCTC